MLEYMTYETLRCLMSAENQRRSTNTVSRLLPNKHTIMSTSRIAPWLKKPSVSWTATTSCYKTLLSSHGKARPLVFNVRDEHANVFKVVLGNPHSCTCSDN